MRPFASNAPSVKKAQSKSSMGYYKNNSRTLKENSIDSTRKTSHSSLWKKRVSRYSITGKSIAEENMEGYGMLKGNQINQSKLRVAFPQRVQLPIYFNTPRRDDLLVDYTRYKIKY